MKALGLALMALLWAIGLLTVGRAGILYAAMFTMAQGVRPVAWSHDNLMLSLWYTLPVLGIILAHEMGHYVMCRLYRVRTAGPFLLPLPISIANALHWFWLPAIGLLGGVLWVRDKFPSPVARWDIAWTGLAAGFLATIICTWLGAMWSVQLSTPHAMGRIWTPHVMRLLAGPSVAWHPIMAAAWVGWGLTTVSLLPIPPADGGHLFWIVPKIWRQRRWPVVAFGGICLLCWV